MINFDDREKELENNNSDDATEEVFLEKEIAPNEWIQVYEFKKEDGKLMYVIATPTAMINMPKEQFLIVADAMIIAKRNIENRDSIPNQCQNVNCKKFGFWHPNENCEEIKK